MPEPENARPLSAAEIFGNPGADRELLFIPEWGGAVLVRGFTATERQMLEVENLEAQQAGRPAMDNYRERIAMMTCIDESGAALFDPDSIGNLGEVSAAALDRIMDCAMKLSGMAFDSLDDAAGKSGAAPA